jgi:hypothetical protein
MTDVAALLYAFSDIAGQARSCGLIDTVITCGQATGGDLEAVSLHSGLLAAHHVAACDIAIAAPVPGTVGTSTAFGTTAVSQGEALNAAATLEGLPVAPLRLSFADARSRHRGVSHHSVTVLSTICLVQALVALPAHLPAAQMAEVVEELELNGIFETHNVVDCVFDQASIDLRGLNVTTMGRNQQDDPAFFSAAYAAGVLAARLLADFARAS